VGLVLGLDGAHDIEEDEKVEYRKEMEICSLKQRTYKINKSTQTQENVQPWVVMTPPSLRAPKSNSKYGFWNRLSAGPSGSEESVMMTSNSFL
jgi:hypothetical protein